jgi:hypothetical protein
MSLLEKLQESKSKAERHEVTLLSVKSLGAKRWDKDKKEMVDRNALEADTLVVFSIEGKTYTRSCYAKNCFPNGYPMIGIKGIPAVIVLTPNKDEKQQPNVTDVTFDTDTVTAAQVTLMQASKATFSL